MDVMAEFRSNLLLLLHNLYPEGLPLSQLEEEYNLYYQQDVKPQIMGDGLSWQQIFQQPVFREDFAIFEIGRLVCIKANRKRSPLEMSLIAKLAQHSNFEAAKKPDFQVLGSLCCQKHGQGQHIPIEEQVKPEEQAHHIEYPHMATSHQGTQGLNNNGQPPEKGQELQHSEVETITAQLSSVELRQCLPQQHCTAVGNDSSKTPATDKSKLRQADRNRPVPTVTVRPSRALPPAQGAAATTAPPSSAEGFAEVPQPQVQTVRDDSPPADNEETVEEPQVFKCSTPGCNREFPDNQHQVDHERRCEMKRYPCTFPDCDRRFLNKQQQRSHFYSVHRRPEPSFKCSVPECTAAFPRADRLAVHEARCRFKYAALQQMAAEGGARPISAQDTVNEGSGSSSSALRTPSTSSTASASSTPRRGNL